MRIYRIVQVVLIIILFCACNQKSDVTIGFLIPASEGYRWPIDQEYVERAANELNARVITVSAENDENLQIRQAEDLLEQKVDVLIVVPVNSTTSAAIVRSAHNQKVPVIAYDRMILNSDLDYLVTFDGNNIGSKMLDHALSIVPRGNYVMLYGEASDMNAQIIRQSQERLLQPHIDNGDIRIIFRAYCDNWSCDNAYFKMKQVLNFTDEKIDAVITSYDGLAIGALRAFNEIADYDIKVLTGQDAEIAAVRAIAREQMSLTIYKSISDIANTSVDLAVKLAKNKQITGITESINNGRKDVPVLLLDPVSVTKENIKSTVVADGFLSENAIYGSDNE